MITNSVYGINNGLAPDEHGPVIRRQRVTLDASGGFVWDDDGGNGSSIYGTRAFQTIFVGNPGAKNIRIIAQGTLFTFSSPKFSEGYYPLVCLRDNYGFRIEGGDAGVVLEIALYNVMLPTLVWSVT